MVIQERWENGIIAINIIDHLTMVFFTLGGYLSKLILNFVFLFAEYLVRLACAPRKWDFIKAKPRNIDATFIRSWYSGNIDIGSHQAPLNVIDILAILPYYFGFILEGMKDTLVVGRVGKVIHLLTEKVIKKQYNMLEHKLVGFAPCPSDENTSGLQGGSEQNCEF